MALSIGIIGLPNVGKSTLYNALTQGHAEASAYPFCTVEPNVSVVQVPDDRLDRLNRLLAPKSCTPTQIRFVDIAGLIRGASMGEGLGNTFLSHVRDADALIHVVRCFTDEQVAHVDETLDPIRDVDTIETELLLADLEKAEEALNRLGKRLQADPRGPEKALSLTMGRLVEALQVGRPLRQLGLSKADRTAISDYGFLTLKPVLYVANQDESDESEAGGADVQRLRAKLGEDGVLPISARIESEILQLPPEDRREFAAELGLGRTGLERLIVAGYRLLDVITFYTVANDKLRAWQIPRGTLAPQAAGRIHSDMESGFIRAETVDSEELLAAGGVENLRAEGRVRTEGRDYAIRDGDVVQFLFKN